MKQKHKETFDTLEVLMKAIMLNFVFIIIEAFTFMFASILDSIHFDMFTNNYWVFNFGNIILIMQFFILKEIRKTRKRVETSNRRKK